MSKGIYASPWLHLLIYRGLGIVLCFVAYSLCSTYAGAQTITTYAGNGFPGYSGDGGPAVLASLDSPTCLAFDRYGNMYINDQWTHRIRKVSPSGIITTIAGTGIPGYSGDGGPATAARLNQNWGMAADAAGNVYIADQSNYRIRKVNTAGIITTIAGSGFRGFSGDGGPATAARMGPPIGIAADDAGNVYVGDPDNKRVRKINVAGTITTYAGNGSIGYAGDGGLAINAKLSNILWGLATDREGNLYICDGNNHCIRKVDATGVISTLAGGGGAGFSGDGGAATAAKLHQPTGIFVSILNELYISDYYNNRIRKVNSLGIINTIAGTGAAGYNGDDQPATTALLHHPIGVTLDDSDNVYLSDMYNARIRKINTPKKLFFTGGRHQLISACQDAGPVSLNAALTIVDSNTGLIDKWILVTPPAHGSAAVAYTTFSTGMEVVPSGLSYTPASGYTGHDTFMVRVTNGTSSDISAIYVTVFPVLTSAGTITGPSSVCERSVIFMYNPVAGGTWSTRTANAAITAGVVTGISAGPDTVYYTLSNFCNSVRAQKAITVHATPDAGKITGPNAVCIGDTILLNETVSGGTWWSSKGLAYVAASGAGSRITGLMAGLDTIIYALSNRFCTDIAVHAISIDTFPDAGHILGPQNVCTGSSLLLLATNPGGIWSCADDQATITPDAGTCAVAGISVGMAIISYRVFNSCGMALITHTLSVDPLPAPPLITFTANVIAAPAGYASYQWYKDSALIPQAVADTYLVAANGAYFLIVENIYGCAAASAEQYCTECSLDDLKIFPNPADETVYAKWCKKVSLQLVCMDGRVVNKTDNVNEINLSELPNGVYILVVYDNNGNKIKSQCITKLKR